MEQEISRLLVEENKRGVDEWGYTHASGIHIGGRIVLNVWRIMRSEVKTNIYDFENVVYHVLQKR